MTRPSYGTVGGRPPNRGSGGGGAAWQWIIIGGTLGFGCAAVFMLLMLTLGVLEISTGEEDQVAALATDLPDVTEVPAPEIDIEGTIAAALATNLAPIQQAQQTPDPQTDSDEPVDVQATIDAAVVASVAGTQAAQQPPAIQDSAVELPTNTPRPTTGAQAAPETDDDEGDEAITGLESSGNGTTTTGTTGGLTPPQSAQQIQQTDDPRLQRLLGLATPLITIQGGTFTMGTNINEIRAAVTECQERDLRQCQPADGQDSVPEHSVQISDFFIDRTQVTYEQYLAFLDYLGPGSHLSGCGGFPCVVTTADNEFAFIQFDSQNYDLGNPQFQSNLPVGGVTWYGAREYCETIGRRLPTEAEWEYVARGGNVGNIYPWGNTWNPQLADVSSGESRPTTPHAVASRAGNVSLFGTFDMAGNVAEWVNDWYFPDYYAQQEAQGTVVDPTGPTGGSTKVLRGGSWNAPPFFSRSVHRLNQPADSNFLWIGFRCAADVDPSAVAPASADTGGTAPGSLGDITPADDLPDDDDNGEIDARPSVPNLPGLALPNVTATPASAVPPGGD